MIHDLKPYPEYKDSGVEWLGQVPAHWEVERLKSCVRNVIDQTTVRREDDLYVALEHVESWTGRLRTASDDAAFDSQVKRFRAGDVLFGKLRPYLAKVARPNADGVCVGEFLVLRPCGQDVSAAYLENLIRSKPIIEVVNSSTFGAKMPRADWHFVGGIRVPIPPHPEQRAIVRFLDYVDRRVRRVIRARQRLVGLLEEYKQALIHQAVTGRIDVRTGQPYPEYKPSGVQWLGQVPAHWEICKIAHFARVGNGSTPLRGRVEYWRDGNFPWLNSSVVNRQEVLTSDQYVTEAALRDCHLPVLAPGTVLVAITGQGKTRGKATVLRIRATINQHIAYIAMRGHEFKPEYVRGVLDAAYEHIRSLSDDGGSTKGALTCEDVRRLKIPRPPDDEQVAILEYCDWGAARMGAAIHAARREIELLGEFRTRLIADVVTGKLDVREVAARLPEEREPTAENEILDDVLGDDVPGGEVDVEAAEAT